MIKNVSKHDKDLIKAGLRRAMSRSDLRKEMISALIIEHSDPKRKRVKTWCRCPECGLPEAISNFQLDHISPIVPVDKTLDDLSTNEIADRVWCERDNLRPICKPCHKIKTRTEGIERRMHKNKRLGIVPKAKRKKK